MAAVVSKRAAALAFPTTLPNSAIGTARLEFGAYGWGWTGVSFPLNLTANGGGLSQAGLLVHQTHRNQRLSRLGRFNNDKLTTPAAVLSTRPRLPIQLYSKDKPPRKSGAARLSRALTC